MEPRPANADYEPDEAEARPALLLDLDGFEGPLDLLLALAREQKVDLARISILQLADQYLAFIARMRREDFDLAADYLVMAAWLAYLKSRLLLPEPPAEDEPGAEEMAAALAFQLRRLEAMREVGQELVHRPRLGLDMFARGAPEQLLPRPATEWQANLYELLTAYAERRRRRAAGTLHIELSDLYSVESALRRLEAMFGRLPRWTALLSLLPPGLSGLAKRSATAAHFVAVLELVRQGRLNVRQEGGAFGPIWLRAEGEKG